MGVIKREAPPYSGANYFYGLPSTVFKRKKDQGQFV
jgi:hypothetical protein